MDDDDRIAKFPDGEPVRGIQKLESGSGFIVIICILMAGAFVLGGMCLKSCGVVP